ncbi:MAG TPA: hypothetical protein VEW93_00855 [Acidimicrobiales bacterium]|nr:hypothetical protein [Acidimicrobiales bacterium]
MGLFSKAKKGAEDAAQAAQHASAYQQQQTAADQPGVIGVQGMGPIAADPALLGGPSTKPLSEDDPMLQPVNDLSLEIYGSLAKEAQARGITDEDGMAALAESEHGIPAAEAKAAFAEWTRRMGQAMVVGQQFRKHMGY